MQPLRRERTLNLEWEGLAKPVAQNQFFHKTFGSLETLHLGEAEVKKGFGQKSEMRLLFSDTPSAARYADFAVCKATVQQ